MATSSRVLRSLQAPLVPRLTLLHPARVGRVGGGARALSGAAAANGVKIRNHYGIYVGGKEVVPIAKSADSTFTVENPATGEALCTVHNSSDADVDHAVNVAHDTFTSGVWSRMDVRDRSKIMFNIAHNLRQNLPHYAKIVSYQIGLFLCCSQM
jgi:hypothetical protein